eukprot:gene9587-19924_t
MDQAQHGEPYDDKLTYKRIRRAPKVTISNRIKILFHGIGGKPHLTSKFKLIHDDPSVYVIDGLFSASELDHLDSICKEHSNKFQRSFTEDDSNEEVISEHRTSRFIYLSKGQDNIIRNIEYKAAEIVGLTSEFVEPLQIVSYTNGQMFDTHHDAGSLMEDGTVELVHPRRLITIFLYLNTLPEGEGHTEFPLLNLSIQPKRGCAVLFCNVDKCGDPDTRLLHKACPVSESFTKYGVNIWISDGSMQDLALLKSNTTLSKK